MTEHRIRKNEIIYIIPTDELFMKWSNGEAFIDEYGRLMNRKPHRVLKELKHYVANAPAVQQRTVSSSAVPTPKSSLVMEYLKDTVRDRAIGNLEGIIDRAVDKLFYDVLPNVWHEHIVPFYYMAKESLTAKELKIDVTQLQTTKSKTVVAKPRPNVKMAKEETDAEKRKVLYHWLGLLDSLAKLQNAGELDVSFTLEQLTNPAMLKRVNVFLSENPNLLETDRYILLHSLLGRDLYKEGRLLPIEAAEVKLVAASYGFKTDSEKMEV